MTQYLYIFYYVYILGLDSTAIGKRRKPIVAGISEPRDSEVSTYDSEIYNLYERDNRFENSGVVR